jgi:F-type H+-transporting ATPase subunit b
MDSEAKNAVLDGALKTASEPALVRSAFELPAEQRAAIQNALNETFSAEIRSSSRPRRIWLAGLSSPQMDKGGWSIADYLKSLEKGVGELLNEQLKRELKPGDYNESPDAPMNVRVARAQKRFNTGLHDQR